MRRHHCAAVIAVLLVTGCGSSGKNDPDVSVPTQQDALAAAVRVEAYGCNDTAAIGAGSFVASERVITVAHVVAGSQRVEVILADGSRAEAKVTAIDRFLDLALLDVEVEVAPLALGTMSRGSTGTFVVYRDDAATALPFQVVTAGNIEVPDLDDTGSSRRHGYELDADVLEGDSGSVLVSHGVATGVVFARSAQQPGTAWAIDIVELRHLLAADTDAPVDTGACVGG